MVWCAKELDTKKRLIKKEKKGGKKKCEEQEIFGL